MSLLEFLVGFLTGIISGCGIGGGSLLILYLTSVAGVNQYQAGGINLLYFICCAPAALIGHIRQRRIEWKAVICCSIAGVVTSVLAALLAARMDVRLLHRLFGVLLLYIGAKELLAKAKPPADQTGKNSPA